MKIKNVAVQPLRITREVFIIVKHLIQHPRKFWHALSARAQRWAFRGLVIFLIILIGVPTTFWLTSKKIEAAWWNDSWGYRKAIAITNSSGGTLTDFQLKVLTNVDLSADITAGKIQASLNDLRFSDINGKILPYWIEDTTAASVDVWIKINTLPTTGATVYFYYGNPSASAYSDGNRVFEFFDDFNDGNIDTNKWAQGTIGSTSGTIFSESSGTLAGGNTNRYIQSMNAFTGNYAAKARVYTTSSAVNGFSTVGFYASSSNSFGILDHSSTSYYRNDGGWTNFSYNGTGQWNIDEVKVAGTAATYWRTGETSGSSTNSATNSGISNEYLRLGPRYDDGAYDQNYTATWDWVFVRKTVATEPASAAPGSEEKGTGPVGYWKFDDGQGTTAQDSTANNYDGTFLSAPVWKTEDQCVAGKCLAFDNVDDGVSINNQNFTSLTDYTMCAWINPKGTHKNYTGTIMSSGDWNVSHWAFGISSDNSTLQTRRADGTNSPTWAYTFPLNKWSYTCITRSGSTVTAYVDGKITGSPYSGTTGNLVSNATNTTIGRETYASGYFSFNGQIDEPKIYNYARSAAQVKMDYAVGVAGANEGSEASLGGKSPKWMTDGLAGYWKMDESSGNCIDSSGNGITGTANGTTVASGKFGNGRQFNGTSDNVAINYTNPVTATSVVAWFKKTGTPNGGYHIITGGSNVEISINDPGGYIRTGVTTATMGRQVFNSGSGLIDGNWHQVAMTYDGSSLKSFIDGAQTASNPVSGSLSGTAQEIGRYLSNSYVANGIIDETRIYNRALSPQEVTDLYNFAPGPVGWWKMDDKVSGNSKTLVDSSGNGNNATTNYGGNATGMNCTVQGKIGGGCSFDGTDDYVDAGNNSNLRITGTITLEAWVKPGAFLANPDHSTIVTKPSAYYLQLDNSGHIQFLPKGAGSYFSSNGTLTANSWYHVVGTYDGAYQKIYINGVLDNSGALTGAIGDYTNHVGIGMNLDSSGNPYSGYYRQFQGSLDDVKIYNYARTADQIKEDMLGRDGSSVSPKSTVGYWKFDEGAGGSAHDSSGNGYDGTITSAAWTNDGKFGKALTFANTNDKVQASSPIITGTGDFTFSAWIKRSSTGTTDSIISNYGTGTCSDGVEFFIASDKLYNYISGYTSASTTINANTWYYVSTTRKDGLAKTYINGKEEGSATLSTSIGANCNLAIGNGPNYTSEKFDGQIDEAKVYNYALTADEIKADMNQGQAMVLGNSGTSSTGAADNSASREYCLPGDNSTCNPPIAEWKMDENTGTTASDTSGNGRDLSFGNTPTWTRGKIGSALDFDRGDYAYKDWADFTLSNQTIEFWVKARSLSGGWEDLVGTSLGSDLNRFHFYPTSSQICFYNVHGSCGTLLSGVVPVVGQWYHVAATTDGTNAKIYINGQYKNSMACSGSHTATGIYLAGPSGETFDGQIDGVKIFDYARTAAQIAYDYNRGGPVGWWKLDECQGTTLYDASGNGNNGTWQGGTAAGTCTTSSTAWGNGASGKWNSSLSFNGSNDYVTRASTSFDFSRTFSLGAWIKTTDLSSYKGVMSKYSSIGTAPYISLYGSGGTLRFECSDVGSNTRYLDWNSSISGLTDNQWHFVFYTYDGSNVKSYKDGVYQGASSAWTYGCGNTSDNFNIGTFWGGSFLGQIDDARIYNYALTADQIKQLYNGGAVSFR